MMDQPGRTSEDVQAILGLADCCVDDVDRSGRADSMREPVAGAECGGAGGCWRPGRLLGRDRAVLGLDEASSAWPLFS